MAKCFLLALLFLATNVFGQERTLNLEPKTGSSGVANNLTDTSFRVFYPTKNNDPHSKKPAYFLNGKIVNEALIYSINPSVIESVDIVKDDVVIDNVTYYGSIYIKTKSSYNPKLVSLEELKTKYLKSK